LRYKSEFSTGLSVKRVRAMMYSVSKWDHCIKWVKKNKKTISDRNRPPGALSIRTAAGDDDIRPKTH